MKQLLPIKKDILIWARTSIGLSVHDVALKMAKSEEVILEWESGKSSPTYPQLEKLAYDVYKRPIAVFFFPSAPEEESLKTEFRTLPDVFAEKLPYELIKLYRKAKVFQLNLRELFDNNRPAEQSLLDQFSINNIDKIPELAAQIRKYLNIMIEEQYSWDSSEIAVKEWRKAFEENGIFVFKDAFHNDDYSGFCVYDKNFPVIYVNNSMPFTRQVFTLFHEIGHLLYHLGGIDFRNNSIPYSFENKYKTYEVYCNKFANEFLVPNNELKKHDLKVTESRISELAKLFSVSREVILRNYLELGLVDAKYYNKMASEWIEEIKNIKKKPGSGHYYNTQKAYLSDFYVNVAFKKYYQEKISIENLSGYLNVKVKNIPTFEHYVLGNE